MKLALVTDAWHPQVNGVVTTLLELVRELKALGHTVEVLHPGLFKTWPCPGHPDIQLALCARKALAERLDAMEPDAIHLATEGPLGWAGRGYCSKNKLAFTTGYHTRFPEMLQAAVRLPLWIGYALLRHFHKPSSGLVVPTSHVLHMLHAKGFRQLRSWTYGVDVDAFAYQEEPKIYPPLGSLARPVSLFVGRVSHEKNLDAFLEMKVPGTKVVCGFGPLASELQARFPHVRWLGVLPRTDLAKVYGAADVFVMPSRSARCGLVMLEAMACGTPVAAFPVAGSHEVIGSPAKGGSLDAELARAWYGALSVPRHEARARALHFGWAYAALLFARHLVPARTAQTNTHSTGGGVIQM